MQLDLPLTKKPTCGCLQSSMLFLCAVSLCLIPLPATTGPSGYGGEQRSQHVDEHMGLQGLPPEHGTGRSQASDVHTQGTRDVGKGWGGDLSAN